MAPVPSASSPVHRAGSPTGNLAPWLAFTYSGSDEPEDLLVATSKDVLVRYWPPGAPVPRGVTFESITVFLSDSNRAAWRAFPGYALIAYPADAAHTTVDSFVYDVRLVCALVFGDEAPVKVFPADINNQFHAPIALIKCSSRAQYEWLRDQQVINNSRRPFFVISRNRPPARLTHTVTGGAFEDDQDSLDALVGLYRSAAHASTEVRDFALAHNDAVPGDVTDFHAYLADSITASPLRILKRNTRIPAINWRIECARMTLDVGAVNELNSIIRKLHVQDDLYGTPQVIKAPHCSTCGCIYHMHGLCVVATSPTWLGTRPTTEESSKAAQAAAEDEALPNAGLRIAAARVKNEPANVKKGGRGGKTDRKGKGKRF